MKKRNSRKETSRSRLLVGADRLLRRSGYAGTVLSEIAKESRAPMGSVYFHFPGGKEQLAAEAMRFGSESVGSGLRAALNSVEDPAEGLARCARKWADDLEQSNWMDGCPVAATALQVSATSTPLKKVSAEIMSEWSAIIADHLKAYEYSATEAEEYAEMSLALLEGAEMMAKIQCDRTPLDRAALALKVLLRPPARGDER